MLGERSKLERVTVRGRSENSRWGTRGINTLRSITVTAIFQSRNLREKSRNFRTLKHLLTTRMVGTSEQGNNRGKQQQVSLLKEWVRI
jgi:hypothetical protein